MSGILIVEFRLCGIPNEWSFIYSFFSKVFLYYT